MFELLGLSPADEALYRRLLRAAGEQLSTAGILEGDEQRQSLAALIRCGLVSYNHDDAQTVAVSPPDVALPPLLEQRQHELNRIRADMGQLMADYRRHHRRSAGDIVEPVVGQEAVRQRYRQLLQATSSELRCLVHPPHVEPLGNDSPCRALLARGVVSRALYDKRTLAAPDGLQQVQQLVDAGEQARIMSRVPLQLAIFDDRYALVPLPVDPVSHDVSLLIRQSSLLVALIELFEQLWSRATAMPACSGDSVPARHGDLEEEDRALLSMLVAGMTDAAIGRQLGLSPRTVQRRIASLCRAFGVRGRIDLTLMAAREPAQSA